MFWTALGVVFGGIGAIVALLSFINTKKTRKRSLNELFIGKQLVSKRGALEISGELESGLSNQYWIHIYNSGNRENGLKAILFFKGNPKRRGFLFEAYPISENGHFFQIKKGETKDIYLDSAQVIENYEKNNGKWFGKATDDIYILLKDLWENRYIINTHLRIEGFKELVKHQNEKSNA